MADIKYFKNHRDYLSYYRRYRQKNRKKLREYNRKYNKKWRAKNGYHNERKWTKNNQSKIRIFRKLRKAIKKRIIKKKPCEVCSEKAQSHHPDYRKKLKVIWLCAKHHKWAHIWFSKKINKTLLIKLLKIIEEKEK